MSIKPLQQTGLRRAAEQQRQALAESVHMDSIKFKYRNKLDLVEVLDLYRESTLGERRPIDDTKILSDMIRHANLVVTAWDRNLLVGISRTLTDFSYVGYLSDLAVRQSYQSKGIGTQLIQKTREKMGPRSMLVLLAAPKAVDYYPKIGFTKHESAWVLRATDKFPVVREEDAEHPA